MKEYLLTWYGITDLKASLGLETSDGPVLGALLTDDYSDIVILGYSNPEKSKPDGSNRQKNFHRKLKEIKKDRHNITKVMSQQFVNEFANTDQAHEFYIKWLKAQLLTLGIKTKVIFQSVILQHLNDTEGIYETANICLETLSSQKGEKRITFNLSPGTPVMAFVWAFVALRYPNLEKRMIASSQTNKPPETIVLPNEWLEWHGRQVKSLANNSDQYDIIFHLFGEQRMPNLLGVLQFSSKKHVFVNSRQFPADVMKQFVGSAEFCEISVDPYDPENIRATILEMLATMPSNISVRFNLTGGTKLMYAGALAACRKVNATPFYFNSRNNKVIFLNDFSSDDTKSVTSVETFINLNGNNLFISKSGHWKEIPGINSPGRKNLTNTLWRSRSNISKLYRDLSKYNNDFMPFEISIRDIFIKLSKNADAEIRIGSENFQFNEWPNFAQYLSGGWFEEYTYMRLEPFVESGLIKDMRIGLEVSFKEDNSNTKALGIRDQLSNLLGDTYQELDVAFTEGKHLYIVECKAGNVNSGHVMKLQNVTRYFGGIEGRAILVSCFSPNSKVVRKKINDSKNLQLASGSNFFRQLEAIIQQ